MSLNKQLSITKHKILTQNCQKENVFGDLSSEIITSLNLLCEQNWGDKQSNTFKVTFRTSFSHAHY